MAQPAVSVGEDRTDLIGVPAFLPKPTTESLFPWESWTEQFFLAVNLREHCNAYILLSGPVEVLDDPLPDQKEKEKQKTKPMKLTASQETKPKSAKQIKSTTKEGRMDQKSAQTYSSTRRTKGDYSFLWEQKAREGSYKAKQRPTSASSTIVTRHFSKEIKLHNRKNKSLQHPTIRSRKSGELIIKEESSLFKSLESSLFKRDKNYIIERINLYNTQQLDRESLEAIDNKKKLSVTFSSPR